MHNATFGRARYLAGNILELQALAKLYSIPPMGNPRMPINWVDALVEYLPQAKVIRWGELRDKGQFRVEPLRESILAAYQQLDNEHNPSAIQLAILARLIELKPRGTAIDHIVEEKGLSLEEFQAVGRLWQLYRLKQLMNEALDILQSL